MNLKNKKIVIVGLGKSGVAAACFTKKMGAVVTVTDSSPEETMGETIAIMEAAGIGMELGHHKVKTFEQSDLIVVSPGVPETISPLAAARKKGIPIMGEFELATRFIKTPMVAITGTNGKTTTATLLGRMLEKSGLKVFLGGNIGNPLISYVDQGLTTDVVVSEISSFQLDTTSTFRPRVGVLLNIAEDHLDRYADFNAYATSKGRIFKNQLEADTAILNGSDPIVRALGTGTKARKLYFNYRARGESGVGQERDRLCFHGLFSPNNGNGCVDISGTVLAGKHNRSNISAAALATLAMGGNLEGISSALSEFRGLAHRFEQLATINGVRYINDSKATNVDAVMRALESLDGPVILIMGGRDKGSNYKILEDSIRARTKRLIVMGEAHGKIVKDLGNACRGAVSTAGTMQEAVTQARNSAVPGDVVLLSPACSSFDAYANYVERGEAFTSAVNKLNG
jgi:UDP-N-acetylmuramoylalanine--D-glutamate ligase